MRVCLVNPNYREVEFNPAYIPLGLAYIAAVLRNSGRHEVKVIDAYALNLSDKKIEEALINFKPDIVAAGSATETLKSNLKLGRIAKKNNMLFVLGGPHPSILPEETLAFDEVDIVIIGEGEYALLDLADAIENKKDLRKVKGIMFKKTDKGGKVKFIKTPTRPQIENLDELPLPARDLFPWKLYPSYTSTVRKLPAMHMMSSRGCAFKCTFCGSQSLWKCARSRSPKNIVDEMEYLTKEYGIKEIYLFDDTFNLDLKRCEDICDEIIKRKLKISIRVHARVYPMTMHLLQKMKKAGVWMIYYGVESGNQEVLNDIKKGTTLKQIREAFAMTKKAGIRTFGFFMIGLPKDTKETIQDTLNLALEIDPDIVTFTILVPYPGTEAYELAIKEGRMKRIKPKEIWNPPTFPHKVLSDEELQKELTRIYKKFNLRPKYLIRKLLSIKTLPELKSNLIAGLPFLMTKNPFIVTNRWIPPDQKD